MQRNTLKYAADVGLYSILSAIAVTGAILRWVIPRGGGHRGDRFFLGLHRHDWADIHAIFAVGLVALLVLHLWLNWKWVVNTTRHHVGDRWRGTLSLVAGSWIALLFIAWLLAMVGSCLG